MLELNNVSFSYSVSFSNTRSSCHALSNINLSIAEGSFVAVLGSNGSGKSTLAKLLNALLIPTEGRVLVDGLDSKDKSNLFAIRSKVGIVFQNPDTQIICDTVEDDIVFGLENMGLSVDEMKRRLERCLQLTGLESIRKSNPQKLSGGQKQLVAIAGILAMQPKCIVLDEATAMLDSNGRKMVVDFIYKLNLEEGITIVLITHHIEECTNANRVVVLDKGRVAIDDEPMHIFENPLILKELGLSIPSITDLCERLISKGINLPHGIITKEQFCLAWKNRSKCRGIND